MKFFKAIASGAQRVIKASKQVVMIWFISVLVLSLLMIPFRNALLSLAGSSMSTGLLNQGFDISYFLDFSPGIMPLFSSLTVGVILYLGLSLILNIFLSGGLFDALRTNSFSYRTKDFFSASAKLFFPFLWVNLIVILIILFSVGIFVGIPIFIAQGGNGGEGTMQLLSKIMRITGLLLIMIYLLVADYARAWLAASESRSVFKAVGYGFKAVFTSFVSSYLFMIVAVGIQLLFTFFTFRIMGNMNPAEGGGLFLMLIISNLLFIIRIYFRTFRYGGVSALYALG